MPIWKQQFVFFSGREQYKIIHVITERNSKLIDRIFLNSESDRELFKWWVVISKAGMWSMIPARVCYCIRRRYHINFISAGSYSFSVSLCLQSYPSHDSLRNILSLFFQSYVQSEIKLCIHIYLLWFYLTLSLYNYCLSG